jgi:hypothetical protein
MFSFRQIIGDTAKEVRKRPGTAIGMALVFLLMAGGLRLASSQEIGYTQDPNAGKRMTLLLKDYEPRTMAHLASHEVPRARFAAIDIHNHINDAQGIRDKKNACGRCDYGDGPREPQEDRDPYRDVGR